MHMFRKAAADDIPLIQDLARRVWREAYRRMLSWPQIDYMLEMMYSAEVIGREIEDGIAWELILDRGRPCGFISYHPAGNHRVKLSKIYIEQDSRGKSIAGEAIMRVVKYAADTGMTSVFLTVNRHNKRAVRAYEKNGFLITDSVVTAIGGGFVMDDYIMTRAVKKT
ncbi:MAG: GNAT family N-acetyltransferase [Nitrospiraceae bacterium]|nr:GNAT family N-acetyltransferase [Nitrospiraceae bacterium]